MRKLVFCLAALLFSGLPSGAWPESVVPPQVLEIKEGLCFSQTAARERSAGIPHHLLTAISLAESGRWNAGRRENVAWPWTVTSGGKGRFFPSKAAALAAVRKLQAAGVTNIDVGCMQVNLHFHGDAFADLEQALDPFHNVAYGAQFLRSLFDRTGSWTQAAGYYHSRTPKRTRAYKLKVVQLWDRVRRNPLFAESPYAAPPVAAPPVAIPAPIDLLRTARLNARLRLERTIEREGGGVDLHRRQLDAWRGDGGNGHSVATLAAMRRAQLETQRRQLRMGGDRGGFAAKRATQLKAWRQSLTTPGGAS